MKVIVTFINGRGIGGHENIFWDIFFMDAQSVKSAVTQMISEGGFWINRENTRSWIGPPKFVPYHAVIGVTEHVTTEKYRG